jgi:ABC-2 type transport system permease protein
MVGLFVRLKLRLLAGSLRSPARRAGFVIGLVLGLLVVGPLAVALQLLRDDPAAGAAVGSLLAAVLVMGWAVLPIAAFGSDETLDVARLALLPIRRHRLLAGLLAASLVGVPPLLTAVLVAAAVAAVTTSLPAVPVALLAVALLVATCVLAGRVTTSALSRLLRSRRGRDLAVVVGVLVVLAAQLPRLLVGNIDERGLERVGAVLRWTPPGAAVQAAADASAGSWGPALAELAIAAAAVGLLALAWYAALGAALVVVDASTERSRRRRSGPLLPEGRLRTVAAKELRYAWREPRLKVSWLQMLVFGAVFPAFTLLRDGRAAPLFVAVLTALLISSLSFNAFGPEGSAFWLTAVATGTERDARTDLAGRNAAIALVAMTWVVIAATVVGALAVPADRLLPAVLASVGSAAAVLGAGFAAGALISVLAPYALPSQAGAAFAGPGPGRGCLAGLYWLAGSLVAVVASLPVLLPAALLGDRPAVAVVVALAGPVWGALLAAAGRRLAARQMVSRLPEMLAALTPERT